MSGHSKWSTIKRAKGVNDAKRGQLFSKLARAITLAARNGPDPSANLKLRLAMDKAKESNMPKDNVERALRSAQGKLDGVGLEEVVYEGYGPLGVAILVEAVTDNRNRTTQQIKSIFDKAGGSMSTPGSVAFQFEQKGLFLVEKGQNTQESMLSLIDLGVEDVEEVEDGIKIYTKPGEFAGVRSQLEQAGLIVKASEITFKPKMPLEFEKDKIQRVLKLIESLDDQEDVQKVYANIS